MLIQTGHGLRVQGGNVDVGYGLVKDSSSWTPITVKRGCSQLGGWQSATVKKRPDGMVALRGIVFGSGGRNRQRDRHRRPQPPPEGWRSLPPSPPKQRWRQSVRPAQRRPGNGTPSARSAAG
ncbi:hypothetical protein [Kitasatospora sp. NPDC005751]|uniref:hypothetical protein n=1 Tax=Kitasatospora sp. NPDC005751 TaxID=3157064 RepID=UPI0033C77488